MAKLTRKVATQMVADYINAALVFDDVVDIRTSRKPTFAIFSCRIINDSCVIIIADNLTQCKDYIKKCIGGVDWEQADTTIAPTPIQYRGTTCYAGISYIPKVSHVVLCKLNDRWPKVYGQSAPNYIMSIL